ncbi:MAG: outer membrane protein assembly factor BamC [Pseudomonadales bacterium]|nr:outer membrane protein assembly factor BamC [Pseudomonadales bacterium]
MAALVNTKSNACLRVVLLVLLAALLPSCNALFGADGLYPSKANDYLKASEAPPLRFPESVTEPDIEDAYPIPSLQYSNVLPKRFEVPRVDALNAIEGKGSVRIQRFNDDEWILFQRAPSQTWPLVLHFLNSNQIALAQTDAKQGVIETELLSDASNAAGQLEAYRFELSAGVQKNSTEVRVQHFYRSRDGQPVEQAGADLARQKNMLKLLAEQLANSPDRSSHSLLAQGLGTASKVAMQYEKSGAPYLMLQLPFDRGWASLGLALRKASFEVSDLDRSEGKYFANYIDRTRKAEKKPGALTRLFKRDEKPAQEQQSDLVVEARQTDSGVKISLQRRAGAQLQANEQAFLLRKILQKLS